MSRFKHLLAASLGAAAVGLAAPASAAVLTYFATLGPEATGAQGSGSVTVVINDVAHTLGITANWTGLTPAPTSTGTTVAHIHCCVASPGTVGVAVTPGTLPGFPVGSFSGSYSIVLDTLLATTYTAAFLNGPGGSTPLGAEAALIAGLNNGTAYFNIHSSAFPAGEIRGFPRRVPEPASLALALLGVAGLGFMKRRTRA